jgi:hypothetical protein
MLNLPASFRVVTKVPKVDTPASCPGAAPNESDLDSGVGQMLETPRIRRYSPFAALHERAKGSENPSGADNQQERPLDIQRWIGVLSAIAELGIQWNPQRPHANYLNSIY